MEQIFKTNCNVQPLHGRSIVRGTIYLKAQQLQSKNVSDKTYFKSDFWLFILARFLRWLKRNSFTTSDVRNIKEFLDCWF